MKYLILFALSISALLQYGCGPGSDNAFSSSIAASSSALSSSLNISGSSVSNTHSSSEDLVSSSSADGSFSSTKCALAFNEHNATLFGEDVTAGTWRAMQEQTDGTELFSLSLDTNGSGQFIMVGNPEPISYENVPDIEMLTYTLNGQEHTIRLLEKQSTHCYLATWHLDPFENEKITLCKTE